MNFASDYGAFADEMYGPIDPVVASSGSGKAPGGYRMNTSDGTNYGTRQDAAMAAEARTAGGLWNPAHSLVPWLVLTLALVAFINKDLN